MCRTQLGKRVLSCPANNTDSFPAPQLKPASQPLSKNPRSEEGLEQHIKTTTTVTKVGAASAASASKVQTDSVQLAVATEPRHDKPPMAALAPTKQLPFPAGVSAPKSLSLKSSGSITAPAISPASPLPPSTPSMVSNQAPPQQKARARELSAAGTPFIERLMPQTSMSFTEEELEDQASLEGDLNQKDDMNLDDAALPRFCGACPWCAIYEPDPLPVRQQQS